MKVLPSGFYSRWFSLLVFVLIVHQISAQQVRVLDENNEALEIVWIYNQAKSISVFTNEEGIAVLKNVGLTDTLFFEHLGFERASFTLHDIQIQGGTVVMRPFSELLQEVTVLGRTNSTSHEILSSTSVLTTKTMQILVPQTTVEAIFKTGELFVQKSQMGGGSPIMRGFEANRILLVVDGIRMNNAIYRAGHLQNAITIDPAMLSHIELIFGPSSLVYGSDALGGVIHFRSRQPQFNFVPEKSFSQMLNYTLRFSSANQEKTAHLSWNTGWNKIALLTGVSVSKYEDLRAGSRRPDAYPDFGARERYVIHTNGEDQIVENKHPDVQLGTAYGQLDVFQKTLFQVTNDLRISTNFQFSSSTDVPRYDQLSLSDGTSFDYAEWYYGPQNRVLGSARIDLMGSNVLFDKLIGIAATQRIDEDRYSRKFGEELLEITLEDVWVHSITLDLIKTIGENHKFLYGLDVQGNYLNSKGTGRKISTGETFGQVLSRYPDKYARLWNYGGYLSYIYERKLLQLQTGIRWNQNVMEIAYLEDSPIQWPSYFYTGINTINDALAYSLGVRVNTDKNTSFKINLSSAFRAPNIDDLAKIRVKNGEMLVPNPDLGAENAYNAEISLNQSFITFGMNNTMEAGAYFTHLQNGIVRDDFTLPDGSDRYFDGSDTLHIVANVNADQVQIYGAFLTLQGEMASGLKYGTRLNATYGHILDNGETRPADHIPPFYGTIWLSYEKEKWLFRLSALFNGKKPIDLYAGSEDNPEYATADGSYNWTIFNLNTRYRINERFQLNFSLENILDKHYRPFSSGVSNPGINAVLSVQGKIGQ